MCTQTCTTVSLMEITYNRAGHNLTQFARDFYDADGISTRRYLVTHKGDMVGLAWTEGGAKRLAKRAQGRIMRATARYAAAATNSQTVLA